MNKNKTTWRWNWKATLLALVTLTLLGGCDLNRNGGSTVPPGMSLAPVSLGLYSSLTPLQQYQVTNKLLATLYKGVGFQEFFNETQGINALRPQGNYGSFPVWVQQAIKTPLADELTNEGAVAAYYFSFEAKEYPLAFLYKTPISKNHFDYWMAYTLANTVLFSPSYELSTVASTDVQTVVDELFAAIRSDKPIRDVVYDYMTSEQNWRRFRSPEDNTREMMEIFLDRLNDAEVPLASKACKNWSLSNTYQLVITPDVNTEPQYILDTRVVSCQDFYHAVANHRDLIPAAARTLVQYFFGDLTDEEQEQLTRGLTASNPVTYRDLFTTLIFSQAYLLSAERPLGFEELFYNRAFRLQWQPGYYFFYSMRRNLEAMNQPNLHYKLGRAAIAPLDTLSFAWSHATLREWLMLDRMWDPANAFDQGWHPDILTEKYQGRDYIRYFFFTMLGREPTQLEVDALTQIVEAQGLQFDRVSHLDNIAFILLDYFSRLPELYVFEKIF